VAAAWRGIIGERSGISIVASASNSAYEAAFRDVRVVATAAS